MSEIKKVAVVTGARKGIGLGIAKALTDAGYVVVACGTAASAGDNFICDYVPCNIANSGDRKYLLDWVVNKYGRIDVLVNNAGVAPQVRMDVLETTEESFERVVGINCEGTFFMCQLFANAMIEMQKLGPEDYKPRIVNISSVSAYTSSTSRGEYCISKAGISMVTKLFADRLAEYNIPVFEVRPGIILTDMTACVKEKYDKLISEGITPTKRMGLPEDVAKCVLGACSGLFDFGTGTVFNADGGFNIRRL